MREGWQELHLSEIAALDSCKPRAFAGVRYYVDTGSVSGRSISNELAAVTYSNRPSRANEDRCAGDVGFSKMKLSDKTVLVTEESQQHLYSTGFQFLRPKPDVLPGFLFLVCSSSQFRQDRDALTGDGIMGSISKRNASSIKILLPPRRDQSRIVDLIGSIDAHIDRLQSQVKATRAARSALLADMLSNVGNDWEETTLGSLADWFSGGTPKSTNASYYENGAIRWAVIADLLNDPVVQTAKQISEDGLAAIGGRLAPAGSVLVSMYGTIARTAVAGVALATNQAIAWAEPHEEVCLGPFLRLLVDSRQPEFERAARGAAQKNINRGMIRSAEVTLPPLEIQRQIVDLISALDEQIALLQTQSAAAQNVRAVVLSDLLSGERLLDESYDVAVSL